MDTVTIEIPYYWYVITVTMKDKYITNIEEYNSLTQKTNKYTPASDNWNNIEAAALRIMLTKGL